MSEGQNELFNFNLEPIKGYPELKWAGKRPFTGTSYYPAQLKETHGECADDGWMNKLFWGDNLQVMSHLLKEYRGKIDLIYIDPPFDSKADYKKAIELKGVGKAESDSSSFEEKQYGDIWTNDEYLQFMYERLVLCRELLSDTGSIYLHCDYHKSHHLRSLIDEIFGATNFQNEIIWCYRGMAVSTNHYVRRHDNILFATKTSNYTFNWENIAEPLEESTIKKYNHTDKNGRKFRLHGRNITGSPIKNCTDCDISWLEKAPELCRIDYLDEKKGSKPRDWFVMDYLNVMSDEKVNYPTQKPEDVLERIIKASSNPGDIIFDCFMGSGTTQTVAMKLGRRFLGADINLGAIQTTTKRLLSTAKELNNNLDKDNYYTGFEVYNVNDYDFFRNELEAKKLIIEALGMQALPDNNLWDAELDGRMVSILGINRIATASEFEKIISNMDIASYQKKQAENPSKPVEYITFVCMGHDPNLKAMFEEKMETLGFKVDLEILDILRDKKDLRFKRDADAKIIIKDNKLTVDQFYPMNLLQKLSIEQQDVKDWKQLVDSIMIDWNYDGETFSPTETDIPEKKELVKGTYSIPADAGRIHIKITDLISESWEATFDNNGDLING